MRERYLSIDRLVNLRGLDVLAPDINSSLKEGPRGLGLVLADGCLESAPLLLKVSQSVRLQEIWQNIVILFGDGHVCSEQCASGANPVVMSVSGICAAPNGREARC